jgi:GH15 family glucan-1,4-alpha-glucosidase
MLLIEDYAVIGNTYTAALVGRNGSIDWLCLPRFDSAACFANLLGTKENGRWSLAPADAVISSTRRYRRHTLVLETTFETAEGKATVIDFMPPPDIEGRSDIVRLVVGLSGQVTFTTEISLRFDYGRVVPWVRGQDDGINAVAGPDGIQLRTSVKLQGRNFHTVGHFGVAEGETAWFTLTWHPSHLPCPRPADPMKQLSATETWWRGWVGQGDVVGPWRDDVIHSLITLKALTFSPTGGIVAAVTTSLPEQIGGTRNWDYRFCWLRDATFALDALMSSGFKDEARAWRQWLLRSVAGQPAQLQIMYGLGGEQRLTELELPWLDGYAGSKPVRIGNQAHNQFQLDVFGEVMGALQLARVLGIEEDDDAWRVQCVVLRFIEKVWREPDDGIWEIRGERRHFVYSKVMAWVAFDRAIDAVERFGFRGPVDHWREIRAVIHDTVCREGFSSSRNAFVQHFDCDDLDASALLIPTLGFLPADDPRIIGTVEAIQRDLVVDGLVRRYHTRRSLDGLPPGEGTFIACSFWLADALALLGRREEAVELFERLLRLRNDVGLMAEEFDVETGRQLGNFPQAFSHVALINTARRLSVGLRTAGKGCPA